LREHLSRSPQRRQLQLLLAAEAPGEPALAHAELLGQTTDREPVEADDRSDVDGRLKRELTVGIDGRGGSSRHRSTP
jgi:hypothetical protein